jgi:hypothetical protein
MSNIRFGLLDLLFDQVVDIPAAYLFHRLRLFIKQL